MFVGSLLYVTDVKVFQQGGPCFLGAHNLVWEMSTYVAHRNKNEGFLIERGFTLRREQA